MASPKESIAEKVARTKNGSPRKTRPNGEYYSEDPSVRHAQLVEDGKIGGKGSELARQHGKKGGRPKKVSAQALVAEKAREEAEEIWEALKAGLGSDSSAQRRASAVAILEWEEKYIKRQEREAERREGMDKDAIIGMLIERLTGTGAAARQIRENMAERLAAGEEVMDADYVEVEDDVP